MAMNKSEFREVINASKEKTWEVLFNQYGDIHIHNPTMIASNYMHSASKGELNCVRHCKFDEKLFLEEKITEVNGNDSFTVVVTEHNLPFLKEMSATYEISSIGNEKTEVKMTSFASTSPGFMIYLMRGQLGKSLLKHLFGMKYYTETGKTVNKDNYAEIYKSYT
ncbi:MAG: hypothetical protein ACRBF0_20780 [Calditrichia bacterium]